MVTGVNGPSEHGSRSCSVRLGKAEMSNSEHKRLEGRVENK